MLHPLFGARKLPPAGDRPIALRSRRCEVMSNDKGGLMLRLYAWSYRLAVIGALILAAGAGKKWGP